VQETVEVRASMTVLLDESRDESTANDHDSVSLSSTTLFEDETQNHLEISANPCGNEIPADPYDSDLSSNTAGNSLCILYNMTKAVAHLVLLLTQSILVLVDQL